MTKHIAHILYRFDTGGLENGVVNLINHLPADHYRHSVITLCGRSDAFCKRVTAKNVEYYDLAKQPGQDVGLFLRLNRLLKGLKPDVLHTRNTATIECQPVGWWRRIPLRVHGEHGWDINDLGGCNKKYQWLRRLIKPFIHYYVALSSEARDYLINKIGVHRGKIAHICNGVDTARFGSAPVAELPPGFNGDETVVFGTVGRLETVKNQRLLLTAFATMRQQRPELCDKTRLLIVGDGSCKETLVALASQLEITAVTHFTGNRQDIPELLAAMDVFVLPSLAEGISNTFLEAMAAAKPVIATKVGGAPDLVMPAHATSHLVEVGDIEGMAGLMAQYAADPERLKQDGAAVQRHCHQNFSLQAMVEKYHRVYQQGT